MRMALLLANGVTFLPCNINDYGITLLSAGLATSCWFDKDNRKVSNRKLKPNMVFTHLIVEHTETPKQLLCDVKFRIMNVSCHKN